MLIMVKAIIRPEKANDVMAKLMADGFPSVTKMHVAGRGKQRGIKIGEVSLTILLQRPVQGKKGLSAMEKYLFHQSMKCIQ